jgi:GAF domain-containing protein
MSEFDGLLRRVKDGVDRGALTQQEAAHYVGEHVARRLYCSSATLWTIGGPPGLRVLTRVGGFDTTLNMPLAEPLQVTLAGPSTWLDTLCQQGVFATADVHAEPRLGESHAGLVGLRRVRGLLQAGIGANADLWGFVSCAQYDTPRLWTLREIVHLQRIAIALSLRRSRDRAAARGRLATRVSPAST